MTPVALSPPAVAAGGKVPQSPYPDGKPEQQHRDQRSGGGGGIIPLAERAVLKYVTRIAPGRRTRGVAARSAHRGPSAAGGDANLGRNSSRLALNVGCARVDARRLEPLDHGVLVELAAADN